MPNGPVLQNRCVTYMMVTGSAPISALLAGDPIGDEYNGMHDPLGAMLAGGYRVSSMQLCAKILTEMLIVLTGPYPSTSPVFHRGVLVNMGGVGPGNSQLLVNDTRDNQYTMQNPLPFMLRDKYVVVNQGAIDDWILVVVEKGLTS